MPLPHRTRKRLALLILLVGMPVYVVAAVNVVEMFERPSFLVELGVFAALGILWALPFRFIFRGVAREDPDAPQSRDR
jgi:hypothetical protein